MISLPAVTDIGDYAFGSCAKLVSLSLTTATSIGSNAFRYCSALASVTLGAIDKAGFVPPYSGNRSGDLRWAYFLGNAGGAGRYIRDPDDGWWTKEGNGPILALDENLSVLYQKVTPSITTTMNNPIYSDSNYGAVKRFYYHSEIPDVVTYFSNDNSVSVCTSRNSVTYVHEFNAGLQFIQTREFPNELESLGAFAKDSEGSYSWRGVIAKQ